MTSTHPDHAFCIPAYGNSPWLESCVASLRAQTRQDSEVIIVTSTPSSFIQEIADKHAIPVIHTGQPPSIESDWNFALSATRAKLLTIAHQDDLYRSDFSARAIAAFVAHPLALIAFSDYSEHTPAGPRKQNLNWLVKRTLIAQALLGRQVISSRPAKRRLLAFGNPVCCPSVTFNRSLLKDFRFSAGYRTNLDWDAWTRLAERPGGFIFLNDRLVSKGIHNQSETTVTIANRSREIEDLQMLRRFWPSPMARMLMAIYRLSYASNKT